MADSLKARRVLGGKYTADDVIELRFTYTGDAKTCVHWIEVISGDTVTHGGGAPAESKLHYKAHLRDDGTTDENEAGIIDYAASLMTIVQTTQGTSVIKVCTEILLQSDYDAYVILYSNWRDTYVLDNDMTLAAGAPNCPASPTPTIYKSGEIILEWQDDSFV